MPEGARRGQRAAPVARLPVLQLEAQPPVERVEATDPREHAPEPRELDGDRLRQRLGRDEGRPEQLQRERLEVGERAVHVRPGRAAQLRAHPQGAEDRRGQVLRERDLGPLADMGGKRLEALVRVDPPLAGTPDRRAFVKGEAAGVGEQVTHRRAGRPGRLVQVDRPLLDRHEHGERGRRLGHGGPAKLEVARPELGDHLARAQAGSRSVRRRPALDLAQGVHGARY